MRPSILVACAAIAALGVAAAVAAPKPIADNDPYLWLSDINGVKALDWVKAQNAKSDAVLKTDPGYRKDYDALLTILNSNDRIPQPDVVDHLWVFNFWQDAEHSRDFSLARYHHYEVASAAFQISIVLASAAVITGVLLLTVLAGIGGLIGIAFTAIGLFAPHAVHLF